MTVDGAGPGVGAGVGITVDGGVPMIVVVVVTSDTVIVVVAPSAVVVWTLHGQHGGGTHGTQLGGGGQQMTTGYTDIPMHGEHCDWTGGIGQQPLGREPQHSRDVDRTHLVFSGWSQLRVSELNKRPDGQVNNVALRSEHW
jgi:hypothetical protein